MNNAKPDDGLRLCNLCGSDKRRARYEVSGYHIVECKQCGLFYVAEQSLSRMDLDRYYDEAYYNGGLELAYADYFSLRNARKAHYRSLLPMLRRYMPSGCGIKTLDVGCAAGFFLEFAQETGWQAQGVELSPYMSGVAREELGLDVLTGTLEEVELAEKTFNLVTMWDVIEHLQDPRKTLERAYQLLVPRGLVVISTGDISGATARIYGGRWVLLAPPGHLYFFSRKTLFAMLRQTGFEPLAWQSDGAFLLNNCGVGENGSVLRSAIHTLHHQRWINGLLRRIKLGSIMTVYARRRAD